MTKSWQKRILFMLAVLLVTALFFFAWTSNGFNMEAKNSILTENGVTLKLFSSTVDDRLDSLYSHIYNLLLTIYNNTDLGYDTPMMTAATKAKIIDEMKNHLLVSEDACIFFVSDLQNDIFLLSATTNDFNPQSVVAAKEYWRENAAEGSTPLHNRVWRIEEIGGETYFVKNIKLGKFVAGAMAETRRFDINSSFNVSGDDAACFLALPERTVCLGGNASAAEDLAAAEAVTGITDRRIVNVAENETAAGKLVLVVNSPKSHASVTMSMMLVADSALCVILIIMVLLFMNRKVSRPTEKLMEANRRVAEGDLSVRMDVSSAGSTEFEKLYGSFNDMVSQISDLREDAYNLGIKREEDRLTMLRAQIKPHTFLNAMTTVSNMTYISKPEQIRKYISSFASFTRYMLNSDSAWTPLGNEIRHIENYISMQQVRSPSPITFVSDIPAEELETRIPFLMLYTLAENSVKHGISLTEAAEIKVSCRRESGEDFSGLVIYEEDNGSGFSDEALAQLTAEVPGEPFVKEHLGLTNVRYTLNLLYHRADLIRFINTGHGARVEIMLPDKEERNEASDM